MPFFWNSALVKAVPLSDTMVHGRPCVANHVLSFDIVTAKEELDTGETSTHLEWLSQAGETFDLCTGQNDLHALDPTAYWTIAMAAWELQVVTFGCSHTLSNHELSVLFVHPTSATTQKLWRRT